MDSGCTRWRDVMRGSIGSLISSAARRMRERLSKLRPSWITVPVVLVLTGWAQWALDQNKYLSVAFIVYAIGASLFVWLVRGVALGRRAAGEDGKSTPVFAIPVVAAFLLGGFSFPLFKGNRFSASGTTLWVGGGLLLLWGTGAFAGMWPGARLKRWWAESRGRHVSLPAEVLAVGGIMAVGGFYRWYRLSEIPLEMGCDLPLIYQNIKHILDGEYLIFFPSVPGREGLFFYLVAPYARLFGLNHLTIKLVCTYVGLLTIPAVYFLGKELYGRKAGLFGAGLLAISKWHVMLSRSGFRAVVMPLCVVLLWYFLVRGANSGRRKYFIWAGLIMGLGLYTYNAFLIVPFGVVLSLALHSLADRGKLVRRHWADMLWMYGVMLFVFIPLARYAYESPESYLFRVATRITAIETSLPVNVPLVLLDNLRKTALMFNLRGDIVFVCNVPFQRHLGYVSAIAFVLGFAYCLTRWRRGYNAMTLGFLILTAVPTALSVAFPHEVPNAVRSNAAIVPAVVLAALPLTLGARRSDGGAKSEDSSVLVGLKLSDKDWTLRLPIGLWSRLVLPVVLAGALLYETVAVYPIYFKQFVSHLPYSNYSISLAMARVIDDFADDGESYIVAQPYWYDGNALRAQLLVEEQTWRNDLFDLDANQPPLSDVRGKVLFIVHPDDGVSLDLLGTGFPRGIALEHKDFDGNPSFVAFYGERD